MTKKTRRKAGRTLGALAVLAWAAPAMGALMVWSGGGIDYDWSTGANWGTTIFPPVEGDDIVLDDTTPRSTSVVDAGLSDPGSDGFDIDKLFVGDGMTLEVTGQPLDVNVWVEIEGEVTIKCTKVLEGCENTIIRIGGNQATVLTKTGNSQIVIGKGLCE